MPGSDPVRVGIGRFPAVTVPPCVGVAVNAGLRAAGGYGQNRKVISYMLSGFLSVKSVETAAGGIREVHLRRPLRGIHALYYKQIPLCGQAPRGSKNFLYNFQKLSKNCAS